VATQTSLPRSAANVARWITTPQYDNIVHKAIYRMNSNVEKLKQSYSEAVYASLHSGDSGDIYPEAQIYKGLGQVACINHFN
jgi:hypothetical protein